LKSRVGCDSNWMNLSSGIVVDGVSGFPLSIRMPSVVVRQPAEPLTPVAQPVNINEDPDATSPLHGDPKQVVVGVAAVSGFQVMPESDTVIVPDDPVNSAPTTEAEAVPNTKRERIAKMANRFFILNFPPPSKFSKAIKIRYVLEYELTEDSSQEVVTPKWRVSVLYD